MRAKAAAIILSIVCLLLSLAYYQYLQRGYAENLDFEEGTAIGLSKIIGELQTTYRKIAVGMNANVDMIVSGVALLRELGVDEHAEGKECSEISSLDILEQCFSYFMTKGAAAERHITSKELNSEIVAAATKLSDVQHFVGGNAALMGLKFANLVPSGQVMLCGPVGPKLKSLLPQDILVPESCRVSEDEHHLILEYQKNEQWGNGKAPIASRFIMSHDVANAAVSALERFVEETLAFGSDLVVVSGFHLLEGGNEQFWRQRITDAANEFSRFPKSVPVHLELASMTSCAVMQAIVGQLFPLVNSIGLNEQELVFVSKCMGGIHANVSELERTSQTGFYSDLANWVLEEYGEGGKHFEKSRLSRVHFHCLYFHILAVLPEHWRSNEASVSSGSWTAYSQACETDTVSSSKAELKIPNEFRGSLSSLEVFKFDASNPVSAVVREHVHLFISPVLICRRPLKTVGLGDAISASALLFNTFIE